MKKKLKALYLPFVYWGLIFVLLHNIFYQWGWNETPYNAMEFAKKIVGTLLFKDVEPMLMPLWFLKSLFCGLVICYIVSLINNKTTRWFIIFSLYAIGWLIANERVHLFFSIERELVVSSMVCIGKETQKCSLFVSKKILFIIFCTLILLSTILKIDVVVSIFSYFMLFPICAIMGVLMCYNTGRYISHKAFVYKILAWFGQNSLSILIPHLLGMKIMSAIIVAMGYVDVNNNLWQTPIPLSLRYTNCWLAYSCMGIAVPSLYILVKKYTVIQWKQK